MRSGNWEKWGRLTDDEGVFRELFVKAFGCTAIKEEVESLGWGEYSKCVK